MTTHSVYAFSAASRWFEDACPASIRMTRGMKGGTNPPAELGTAAHELGEFCIKYGAEPQDCIDMVFGTYSATNKPIIVDDAMAEAVSLYVSYANDLMVRTGQKAHLELRVVMSSLGRDDVYGTADYVLVDWDDNTVYVSDYKHGFVAVEVENNKQLIGYAIATLDTMDAWQHIDRVVTTIIQPRVSHINGCIRSQTYSTEQLVQWQARFANSIEIAENGLTKPLAGLHCQYCIKAKCRARFDYVLSAVCNDQPDEELTNTEVLAIYPMLPVITRFCTIMEGETVTIAQQTGATPEGYKTVKSIHRAVVEDEAGLIKAVEAEGLDTNILYRTKLKSKTDAKKVLPIGIVNEYFKVPPGTTTIAKLSDNRPATRVGSVEGVFKPMKGY